jgi:hypothetical protein
MKVWIDKQGGKHYHKEDCKIVAETKNIKVEQIFHYEPIEHQIRRYHLVYNKDYTDIIVDGKRYHPCPICFGHGARK